MSNLLLDVEPKIYEQRNIAPKSYYAECVKRDIITPIHNTLRNLGFYLAYDGVYRRIATAVGIDTPWHHVKHLMGKKCGLDHNVKFTCFKYVPPKCMECWKVVVGPRTLKELFLLLDVEKSLDRPSKCGIELRYYTNRFYGGYFYNNSLDEGRYRCEQVRKAVDEHIGKDVPVILKRACTEYEIILGPSIGWSMTKRQHEIDEELDTIIDTTSPNTRGQIDQCYSQVHTHWMEWAWKNQDPTVKEYIGDAPLYPKTMTYHDYDLKALKDDMVRAKANVKHGIDADVTDAIRATMLGFQMTKGITPEMLGTAFGYEAINPLYRGEHNEFCW